jgi:hypothetical protein
MPDDTDTDDVTWPAARIAEQLQEAGEEALETQTAFLDSVFGDGAGDGAVGRLPTQLNAFGATVGSFKARVQSGGRISIPDAEREALGIEEGDIVQTFVVPVSTPDDD